MKVRFWGARGSIPKPSRDTLRYGGNTSCIEVRSAQGTLVVIDCGTGAHGLGLALVAEATQPVRGSLLISHFHWDHIQGLPFFAPLFVQGHEWDVYAPHGLSQSLRETLAGQMQYTYFPITLEAMGATIRYHDLVEGSFAIDDISVRTQYLDHPALTLGYRLEADGVTLVYACDHESTSRTAIPNSDELASRERRHVEFLSGADLVIHDAQFTAAEYPSKIGWGHSTPEYAAEVCRAADAKHLVLTHHDPTRSDDGIDGIVTKICSEIRTAGHRLEVSAAAEGTTIDLGIAQESLDSRWQNDLFAGTAVDDAIESHFLVFGSVRPEAEGVIRAAAEAEQLPMVAEIAETEAIESKALDRRALLVLDADAALEQTDTMLRTHSRVDADENSGAAIIVISSRAEPALDVADPAVEWLTWPFSEQYAQTRLRASILRQKCRWIRARLPENEARRLSDLRKLEILDTKPEERFDRITRIASAALGAPIAIVSLVDRDRQWFKSCIGLDAKETSRETAFCAHAILEDEVLIVPDTLLDVRFADNPLVTGGPRIRFYAGCPLRPGGSLALGTLCLIDMQPRHFDTRQVDLLRDFARLVEGELEKA